MMKAFLLIPFILFILSVAHSQPCGTDDYYRNALTNNPLLAYNMKQFDLLVKQHATSSTHKSGSLCDQDTGALTIPVVVHIIHATTTALGEGENRTDQEITDIFTEINEGLKHTSGLTFENPYSGIDVEIQLVLASRDPNGNPTSGIVRHADDVNCIFNMDDEAAKTIYAWPTTEYYNFYLVKTITNNENYPNPNNTYGYATFPGWYGTDYDGAVFRGKEFWWGLTLHETGHYLGLYHNFEGGCVNNDCSVDGDRVCDTPPKTSAGGSSYPACVSSDGCDADDDDTETRNPFRPIAMGGIGNITDGNENYMDYTGGCWEAFTAGQKQRMRSALLTTRSTLLTSAGLVPFSAYDMALTKIDHPAGTICDAACTPRLTVTNNGSEVITTATFEIQIDHETALTELWQGSLLPDSTVQVVLPALQISPGTHTITAIVSAPNGQSDQHNANNQLCAGFSYAAPDSDFPVLLDFNDGQMPAGMDINSSETVIGFDSWTQTCSNKGSFALRYNSFGNYISQQFSDYATLPLINLSGAETASLSFDLAYNVTYSNRTTILKVQVSEDCGASYTELYNKTQYELHTTSGGYVSSSWAPSGCSDWRNEQIDLSDFAGKDILVKFEIEIPEWFGQNLYLDNITVDALVTGSDNITANAVHIFPNPSQGVVHFVADRSYDGAATLHVYNLQGQIVAQETLTKHNSIQLLPGCYIVRLRGDHLLRTEKLVITNQ